MTFSHTVLLACEQKTHPAASPVPDTFSFRRSLLFVIILFITFHKKKQDFQGMG